MLAASPRATAAPPAVAEPAREEDDTKTHARRFDKFSHINLVDYASHPSYIEHTVGDTEQL